MRWAAAIVLAGCFSPTAPLGIPCASNGDCPSGQQCDLVDNVCTLPTELRQLRDDSAADFATEGAYLDEVTVEQQGFLGPVAYFTGGVRIAGIDNHEIDDLDTTFDAVAEHALSGTTTHRGLDFSFGQEPPVGVDLASSDDITVVFEGEIELDVAGSWRFQLDANDIGFFELAPSGTSEYVRVVSDEGFDGAIGTFEAPVAGWYRFRGAFANAANVMSFDLRYDPPNVTGNFRPIPLDRLRARVGDLEGLLLEGFDDPQLLTPAGATLGTDSLESLDYDTDPFDLPIGGGSYSLRWSGQILIDVEGDYAFTIDSRDGHRMWLDGQQVADKMQFGAQLTTTTPMRLVPGWHDLVLDTQRNGGGSEPRMSLTVAEGPAFAGEFVPRDHLRPVVGRIGRWIGNTNDTLLAIPDGGGTSQSVTVEPPASFAPTRIHVGYTVDHIALPQLQLVLDPPAGSNIGLAAAGSISGSGQASRTANISTASYGTTWTFLVDDTLADAQLGDLVDVAVTILGDGGTQPFERRYRYESAVRELGDVAAFDVMTWGMRQATDTETAHAQVRTCDSADACASEPWTDVPFGAIPGVERRRFLQYAIDVTTNGDVPTAVDFVELGYSVFVP